MKRRSNTLIQILFFTLLHVSISAQKVSTLTEEKLTFEDLSNPMILADFDIGSIHINENFDFTHIFSNSISTGSDLLRSTLDGDGFTVRDFAVLPASHSNLNRKKLSFVTSGFGFVGLDEETWTLGITDVGDFDAGDLVQSALSLNYFRIIDDIAIFRPIFFVNPDKGNIGIGTFEQTFGAQVFVEETGQNQVGVWTENIGTSNSSKWGIYSTAEGSGSGPRYGVTGSAESSTGTKYGVYGTASGSGTKYAVYANGNLAYTGSFINASDKKFKKNISNFTALDRIMKLQPRSYEMRTDEFKDMNFDAVKHFGFVAQEMEKVFPELVREDINAFPHKNEKNELVTEEIEYLGIDYISLVPILTQAIKEQQKVLEDSQKLIDGLVHENELIKQKNKELEARLSNLESQIQNLSKN